MGSSDKFCLRWNDFEANISSAFKELRQERDFFDVTLTVDDDPSHVLQAHKVILSACSPFFRNMLLRPQTALGGAGLGHPHPLIYLRGVSFEDMRHILDFMYYGEVNVAQDDLEAFLQVAEDLKVKGLTQSDSAGPTPLAPIKHEAPVVPATASQSLKRDPPDRGANGATSQKRPRPSTAGPSTPTVPAHIASDEIQEIPGEAVKSEPGALNAADFEGGENYDGAEGLEGGEGDFEYGQYGDESGDMTYAEGDEGQLLPGTSAGGDESKGGDGGMSYSSEVFSREMAAFFEELTCRGDKVYTCLRCASSHRDLYILNVHLVTHLNERQDLELQVREYVERHTIKQDTSLHSCLLCRKVLKLRSSPLLYHFISKHILKPNK